MPQIKGTAIKIGDTQQISDKFKKRELIVKTEEQYPQVICVEFVQDKTTELDRVRLNDQVEIEVNIQGREWTSPSGDTKYFTSLKAWKLDILEQPQSNQAAPVNSDKGAADYSFKESKSDGFAVNDGLPF
jgi:hypothetical protein